jgi:hypothetical protein
VSNLNLRCVAHRFLSACSLLQLYQHAKYLNHRFFEAAGAAMEGELDLLLSVAGGLGRWQYVDDLKRVYVKDDDCLGKKMFEGLAHHGMASAAAAGLVGCSCWLPCLVQQLSLHIWHGHYFNAKVTHSTFGLCHIAYAAVRESCSKE